MIVDLKEGVSQISVGVTLSASLEGDRVPSGIGNHIKSHLGEREIKVPADTDFSTEFIAHKSVVTGEGKRFMRRALVYALIGL